VFRRHAARCMCVCGRAAASAGDEQWPLCWCDGVASGPGELLLEGQQAARGGLEMQEWDEAAAGAPWQQGPPSPAGPMGPGSLSASPCDLSECSVPPESDPIPLEDLASSQWLVDGPARLSGASSHSMGAPDADMGWHDVDTQQQQVHGPAGSNPCARRAGLLVFAVLSWRVRGGRAEC